MDTETRLRSSRIMLPLFLLLTGICVQVRAQNPTPQDPTAPAETQANQANQIPNLIASLNLTPEQIQKWRAINADLRAEQQAANQRLREARRALAEAIESPTSNEELIKQRAKEVSEAQASTIQLQALREARILQVLTPEQRIRLREIRQRNQALRRQNQQLPDNGLRPRQQGLQRNANTQPGLTPNQRKLMRRQQKP
jgi:Spy/CpxP family protein refolding chaperone